jgi:hypothetical protein
MDQIVIETIQFKRGTTVALEALTSIPLEGEPIYDITLGKLKIGDGIHTYKDLSYISGSGTEVEGNPAGTGTQDLSKIKIGNTIYNITGSGGTDSRFAILDPKANQILLYNETSQK